MKHLVPHALIALALLAWAGGRVSEDVFFVLFVGGHLLAPVWAGARAPRGGRARGFLVGPGTIIGAHALAIVVVVLVLLAGFPEDTWLSLMMVGVWAAAVLAYLLYCAFAFGVSARLTAR